MRLLIVAGGGGHFAAAWAVIQELPKNVEILVVGRKYTFEADKTESFEFLTCKKFGIPFVSINPGRLQRKLSLQSFNVLIKMPQGFFRAKKMIKEFKPDAVLSFGGYVSLPVCFAAKMLNIPIFVHEQTFAAGLSNKIVGKFAQKIFISWEQSTKFFPREKIELTGNPVKKIAPSSLKFTFPAEKLPIIYVTGGTGGAHGVNVIVEKSLETLLKKYIIIHQTGDAITYGDYDRLKQKREGLNADMQKRYLITKFVDPQNVYGILEKADLVISRSGVNTVTELLYLGKPTLFIPLPHGQRNEQLTNALFVKQIGLAEVVEQKNITNESFVTLIDKMINNINSYKKNSAAGNKLIHEDAAQKIISLLHNGN